MVEVTEEEFGALVDDALDEIPVELARQLSNVLVVVEDEGATPDLLGLYDGTPLTERDVYNGVLPDRISIYRLPLLRWCSTVDELREQVRVTVLHEVAHHFGIDDDRLAELGWA